LAQAIASWSTQLVGQRVTCWGSIRDETFTPKNSTRKVTYQVLDLARITTPDFTLPAVSVEAPSEPLFELDPEERDAIASGLPE
jgi:hypothetical protein